MAQEANDGSLATYKQIEISLRSKIREGTWPIGMMLPSRRTLAKEYGVSPITIERAITPLISEGMLRADDRRGTFVAHAVMPSLLTPDPTPAPVETFPGAVGSPVRPPVSLPRSSTSAATVGIVAALYLFNHDHLELHNFWIRLMVQALEQTFSDSGHRTCFYNRVQGQGQPPRSLSDALKEALADGVDAIAIIGLGLAPQEVDDSLAILNEREFPVVCLTSGELQRPVPHVFFDNQSAGYDAAQRLLRNGCREILFLSPFTTSWVQERLKGIHAAIEHAHLPRTALRIYPNVMHAWIQEEDPQVLGYAAARAFLATGQVPAGVICANDGLSFGFLEAAAERGLKAGRDFAMVSFDDHPDARARQLTSLRPPMEAMGQEASRLLLQAMRGTQTGLQLRLRWHLIPRASCHLPSSTPASALHGREGGR